MQSKASDTPQNFLRTTGVARVYFTLFLASQVRCRRHIWVELILNQYILRWRVRFWLNKWVLAVTGGFLQCKNLPQFTYLYLPIIGEEHSKDVKDQVPRLWASKRDTSYLRVLHSTAEFSHLLFQICVVPKLESRKPNIAQKEKAEENVEGRRNCTRMSCQVGFEIGARLHLCLFPSRRWCIPRNV